MSDIEELEIKNVGTLQRLKSAERPNFIVKDELGRAQVPIRRLLLGLVENVLNEQSINVTSKNTIYGNIFIGGYICHDIGVDRPLEILGLYLEVGFGIKPGEFRLRNGSLALGYTLTRTVGFGVEHRAVVEDIRIRYNPSASEKI